MSPVSGFDSIATADLANRSILAAFKRTQRVQPFAVSKARFLPMSETAVFNDTSSLTKEI
jgi:hypothetical protein